MSFEQPLIHVDGLSKQYAIYDNPRDRLKQFVMPRMLRVVGRERRYYRQFDALRDVSFDVHRGETVGIIGRNGSGKSTLLQIICGTLTPTAGTVTLHGRIAALLELGSGFNPEFSGRENVFLNAAILGLTPAEIDERYDAIERFAGIGNFINQPVKTYSSGMVVRLAFATAIHVDPDILVVDEALAVGDTAFQQKCLNRIRDMQKAGVSILLVTHSGNALIEYCDRAIYLRNGRMVMDGECRHVVKVYTDDLVEEEGGSVINVDQDRSAAAKPSVDSVDAAAPDRVGNSRGSESDLLIRECEILDTNGRACSAVETGEDIHVRLIVEARKQVDRPCFGIQLSSVDGIALWSATSLGLELDVPPLPPGRHEFTWRLRATFGAARYVVALGAGEIVEGEYRRLHRLDYAGHFDVIAPPRIGGGWLAPYPRLDVGVPTSHRVVSLAR